MVRGGCVAVATVLLGACAPADHSTPGVPRTTAHLAARSAAGIPDCPPAAPVAPVAGGLPDIALECMGGTTWVRLDTLERRPTIVVTWAQWCDPCRSESPLLARVLPSYGERLAVVMINVADPQPDRAIEFATASGIARWPVIVDPEWSLHTATGTPKALPVTYFVGADGVVVDKHLGGWKDEQTLRDALRETLAVAP